MDKISHFTKTDIKVLLFIQKIKKNYENKKLEKE